MTTITQTEKRKMMMSEEDKYYVIAHWRDGSASLIGLQARTEKRSYACIRWQEDGNFDAKYHVCRFDPQRGDFVCIDTLVAYTPDSAPFTKTAFSAFMRDLRNNAPN